MELFTFKQLEELYSQALHSEQGNASITLTDKIGIFVEGSSNEIFVEVNEIHEGEWIPFDVASDDVRFDPNDNGLDFNWIYEYTWDSINRLQQDLQLEIRAYQLQECIQLALDKPCGTNVVQIRDNLGLYINTFEDTNEVEISIENVTPIKNKEGLYKWSSIAKIKEEVFIPQIPYEFAIKLNKVLETIKK